MPAFFVYIIECRDSKEKLTYYTGFTKDLGNRFKQHLDGRGAKYTRGKKLKLVHYETFLTRSEAMKRENEIKSWNLKKKKELIERSMNKDDSEQ
ncbi:MAG: GIY-YIG nuclease family protein [archaeon]|nr:GIY-YIG nuclease family protein [archaeon]